LMPSPPARVDRRNTWILLRGLRGIEEAGGLGVGEMENIRKGGKKGREEEHLDFAAGPVGEKDEIVDIRGKGES
jgi:hypothetical protein